ALGFEKLQYGINMASSIRLSEKQLPDLYRHLPPICKKLGIAEPEFYLLMDPNPNAWTFGDTKIYITMTSGLVELLSDEELDAVLAHECGHILCRHVLYHSVADYVLMGADSLGLLGALTIPLKFAILYWQRKSELSCDRAGAIVTSPETVARRARLLADLGKVAILPGNMLALKN
ncbi:MAG: M48 family metallopeptidase, partial [Muribaculaceae bacterium]|nr:M48 family metallopeptidase [Muribaculaceae bacterium]